MRTLVSLAAPIATAMAGETVMGLVDTKLVGGLGPAALGGVGVAMTIAFFGYLSIFGLMRGVKVCVAHAVGRATATGRALRASRDCAGAGRGRGRLGVHARRDAPAPAIRIEPAPRAPCRGFLAVFTFGAPASAVASGLTHHRQALGDARTPMTVRPRRPMSSTPCSDGASSTGTLDSPRSACAEARWPR